MADQELGHMISIVPLVDHLTCPVCMGRLQRTHITTCGHRYCESCIRECIDRLHRCPCCNANLDHTQLVKDSQFDALIDAIKLEEASAEKKYFDRLLRSTQNGADPTDGNNIRRLSPIENVLKDHLMKSLGAHENFYQNLQRDVHRHQLMIDKELKQSIDRIQASAHPGSDVSNAIADVQAEAQTQKDNLDKELKQCSGLVAKAFERYLSEHIPDLSVLPVTVSVSLLNKGIQIPDIRLKPQDSTEAIKLIIAEEIARRGDTVLSFENDVHFLCFSPFAKRTLYEMTHIASDIVEHNAECPGVVALQSDSLLVLQYSIRPGSEIAVYGTVLCESDIPKKCFSFTFSADEKKAMDYFHCKSCKLNWICRPCMDVCHNGHEVVPYIFGHQPTWACCYCKKKKNCQIIL